MEYMQLLVHTVDSVLRFGVRTLTKPTRIQQKSQSGDKHLRLIRLLTGFTFMDNSKNMHA